MFACFGPRRLLVGWCPYSPANQWNVPLKSSVRKHKLFQISSTFRTCVRSPCGFVNNRTLGAIVGSRLYSRCTRAAHLDTEGSNDPVVISVIVVGTEQCSLCSKALLSIQRIISILSPPLAYERLPDNLPSAWGLDVRPHILGLQIRPHEEDVIASLGGSAHTAGVSPLLAACGVQRRSPAVSSSEYKSPKPDPPLQKGVRGGRKGGLPQDLHLQAQVQVLVKVGLASLDCAEVCEALGVCKGDVQRLKEEVPIILVGGKPISRLKFNGPAVRTALVEELKTLQGGHPQAQKGPGKSI